jgi:hypothetical protein
LNVSDIKCNGLLWKQTGQNVSGDDLRRTKAAGKSLAPVQQLSLSALSLTGV